MSLFLKNNDNGCPMLFSDFNPWWKSAKVPTQLAGKQRGVRDEIIVFSCQMTF